VPHSTLGYERRFNWAFKATSEQDFVTKVLSGQPDPPTYFATMKRLNKSGPRILGGFRVPRRQQEEALTSIVASGALVIDIRPALEYAGDFLLGTLNIPFNNSFVTWAGWLVPYTEDFYLLLGGGADSRLDEVVRALSLIGLDRIGGYFSASTLDDLPFSRLGRIPQLLPVEAKSAATAAGAVILDVRSNSEWQESHIEGATHIFLGELSDRLHELPKDRPIITQCQSGGRSSIAASVLRRADFRSVSNLTGGLHAWVAAGMRTVDSRQSTGQQLNADGLQL
jgi:hydroxyacylglutathione hydrolase